MKVLHVDNFDLDFLHKMLSEVRKTLQNHHYTAIGFTFKKDENIRLPLIRMKFFSSFLLDLNEEIFEQVAGDVVRVDPFNEYFYWANNSEATIANCWNNPIRPVIRSPIDYTNMESYRTHKIIPFVINSNLGLLESLHYLDTVLGKDERFLFLKVDVNIFPRVYKVSVNINIYINFCRF
jgi:hypothetical protein